MSKREAELTCPECGKGIKVPFEVEEPPTLDQIDKALKEALKGQLSAPEIEKIVQEQLAGLKPGKEDHRHKTADELLDCPECRAWVDKSQKYQVVPKEETREKEPVFEFGGLSSKKE